MLGIKLTNMTSKSTTENFQMRFLEISQCAREVCLNIAKSLNLYWPPPPTHLGLPRVTSGSRGHREVFEFVHPAS